MQRCLDLASQGIPGIYPNPAVGCVIVYDNKIIGEGFHQKYGEPHAEVNALNSIKDQSVLPKSTLFVNLEPCSHYGKTPPCTELIISKGIKKVVVACTDPSEKVNGKGMEALRQTGIKVVSGMLEKDAQWLNRRFFTFHRKKRPYIILKWAQTQDGFMADNQFNSKWISNELSRTLVHKWRAEEMAIMVGTKTALVDNPSLTTRMWQGKNPLRIVIDRKLAIATDTNLFSDDSETIFFNGIKTEISGANSFVKIDFDQAILPQIMDVLFQREIQSLVVEGGAATLQQCIDHNYWDEARVFVSPKKFNKGLEAPTVRGKLLDEQNIENDQLKIWINEKLSE